MANTNWAFAPERLFIHNLFVCCGRTSQDFISIVNDNISTHIEREFSLIKNFLSKNKPIYGKSLLPHTFVRYVEKTLKSLEYDGKGFNKPKKLPDYCLFSCYTKLSDASQNCQKKDHNNELISSSEGSPEDIQTLNLFMECIYYYKDTCDAGAISEKNLRRLFEVIGSSYDIRQSAVIKYLLMEVFPTILTALNKDLLGALRDLSWEDLVCKDLETMEQKLFIQGSRIQIDECNKDFERLFVNLTKSDDCDLDQIGEGLIKIYKKILTAYSLNNLSYRQLKASKEMEIASTNMTDTIYFYDSIISSNIMRFMRWLPILDDAENDVELIEAVTRIIELVRNPIFSHVGRDKIEEWQFGRKKHDKDNLFVLADNSELRKLLIHSMYKDKYICSKFREFYSMPSLIMEDAIHE